MAGEPPHATCVNEPGDPAYVTSVAPNWPPVALTRNKAFAGALYRYQTVGGAPKTQVADGSSALWVDSALGCVVEYGNVVITVAFWIESFAGGSADATALCRATNTDRTITRTSAFAIPILDRRPSALRILISVALRSMPSRRDAT